MVITHIRVLVPLEMVGIVAKDITHPIDHRDPRRRHVSLPIRLSSRKHYIMNTIGSAM